MTTTLDPSLGYGTASGTIAPNTSVYFEVTTLVADQIAVRMADTDDPGLSVGVTSGGNYLGYGSPGYTYSSSDKTASSLVQFEVYRDTYATGASQAVTIPFTFGWASMLLDKNTAHFVSHPEQWVTYAYGVSGNPSLLGVATETGVSKSQIYPGPAYPYFGPTLYPPAGASGDQFLAALLGPADGTAQTGAVAYHFENMQASVALQGDTSAYAKVIRSLFVLSFKEAINYAPPPVFSPSSWDVVDVVASTPARPNPLRNFHASTSVSLVLGYTNDTTTLLATGAQLRWNDVPPAVVASTSTSPLPNNTWQVAYTAQYPYVAAGWFVSGSGTVAVMGGSDFNVADVESMLTRYTYPEISPYNGLPTGKIIPTGYFSMLFSADWLENQTPFASVPTGTAGMQEEAAVNLLTPTVECLVPSYVEFVGFAVVADAIAMKVSTPNGWVTIGNARPVGQGRLKMWDGTKWLTETFDGSGKPMRVNTPAGPKIGARFS